LNLPQIRKGRLKEPTNNRVKPRASKKVLLELKNLYTFYNPILEDVGNSELAEFLFLSTRMKIKELEIFNEA
jgi:hypothetical protein